MFRSQKYGTPSTVEIPDAVSEHLQYFDAVLLENHGALTYSDSLLNAYHKMESVEFYARLLWQTMQIGGPQELNKEQVEKLYEIRRQMGLSGKHPANLCPNAKAGNQAVIHAEADAVLQNRRDTGCRSGSIYHKESYGSVRTELTLERGLL